MSIIIIPRAPSAPGPQVLDDPILQASYELMLERGMAAMTLAEVARRAGVSRMTVYRRHGELADLLSEVLTLELTRIMTHATGQVNASQMDRRHLAEIVTVTTAWIAEHQLFARIIASDPQALLPMLVSRQGRSQLFARSVLGDLLALRTDTTTSSSAELSNQAQAITLIAMGFLYTSTIKVEAQFHRWDHLYRAVEGYLS